MRAIRVVAAILAFVVLTAWHPAAQGSGVEWMLGFHDINRLAWDGRFASFLASGVPDGTGPLGGTINGDLQQMFGGVPGMWEVSEGRYLAASDAGDHHELPHRVRESDDRFPPHACGGRTPGALPSRSRLIRSAGPAAARYRG
ncbi:MAG TPA: hypothetical protein VHZ73_09940 [Vicinamibacterales bacterium]|nr:hypothetical protein [Vicinamibacterales bacterium]